MKKCTICQGEGFHEHGCELKFVRSTVTDGPVSVYGCAERFPGDPLLDTSCDIKVDKVCITWTKLEEMTKELAAVIAKYQI